MQHKSSVVKVGRELSEAAQRVHNLFIFFTRQIADCVADCLVLLSNQGWIRVKCCSLKLMRRLISVMFFFYLYTLCFGTITGFILQYWSSTVEKKPASYSGKTSCKWSDIQSSTHWIHWFYKRWVKYVDPLLSPCSNAVYFNNLSIQWNIYKSKFTRPFLGGAPKTSEFKTSS